jgi:hypothetical protein
MDDFTRNMVIGMCVGGMVFGAIIVLLGKQFAPKSGSPELARFGRDMGLGLLNQWGVFDAQTPPEERDAILRLTQQVQATRQIGVGIGVAVGSAVTLCLTLGISAATDDWDVAFSVQTITILLLFINVGLGVSLGAVIGLAVGLRAVARRATANTRRVLPHRGILDYISAVIIAWAFVGFALAAEINLAGASLSSGVPVAWFGRTEVLPPTTLGILSIVGELLLPVGALACSIWIANLPNPALESDDERTLSLGDLLRARAIMLVWMVPLVMTWSVVFFAGISILTPLHAQSLTPGLAFARRFTPFAQMIGIFAFCILSASGMYAARMGGRINGWAWRRQPTLTTPPEQNAGS